VRRVQDCSLEVLKCVSGHLSAIRPRPACLSMAQQQQQLSTFKADPQATLLHTC
jgi:hypothetical protein